MESELEIEETEQEIEETARVIVSFTYSYTQNKQGKQNEQPESEPTSSLTDIISTLQSLSSEIWDDIICKQVIQIPKLLQSLSALSLYKVGTHIDLNVDQQRIEVRKSSRLCLFYIQVYGDEQVQTELVNQEYGRVMSLSFSTAGGKGEEQDEEIENVLNRISGFLNALHKGRNNVYQPSFQPLPLLARRSEEQIEEEGANEELEAQMNNNVYDGIIKQEANEAKAVILNHFIRRG
ncbi:MAG: hypothetical protein EZS28_019108 [Streblomastix strix]|uniref:Uncharacterized protein n=1 Tax=Streblomastix strix TaxID=222440 RepID=A0A5J4VS16_9EUKA|nr:MAG: hypothetical protein EZS28_019108 [Streblomastix strix]